MSDEDRRRWDAKYVQVVSKEAVTPLEWLVEHRNWLPAGHALEVACGLGDNAIWLAQQGFTVEGWDVSPVGLERAAETAAKLHVQVTWRQIDLDQASLPVGRFQVVVVSRFLQRERLPEQLVQALAPGGVLVHETFTVDQLRQPGNHFKDDRFLLRSNELLGLYPGLRVRKYRDEIRAGSAVASLLAQRDPNDVAYNDPENARQ